MTDVSIEVVQTTYEIDMVGGAGADVAKAIADGMAASVAAVDADRVAAEAARDAASVSATNAVAAVGGVLTSPYPWRTEKLDVQVDANGASRVVSHAGQGVEPVYNGLIPGAVASVLPSLYIATSGLVLAGPIYPTLARAIPDANGALRYIEVFGAGYSGPTQFGAVTLPEDVVVDLIPTQFVVVPILGQSNNDGRGSGGPAIASGIAYKWDGAALVACIGDPVGITGLSDGSLYPAFANRLFERYGLGCVFVPCAVGGTGQVNDDGADDWSTSGTLITQAITRINATLAAMTSAGLAYFPRMISTWAQGENDAEDIDEADPLVTKATYKAAHRAMLNAIQAGVTSPATVVELIIRLGTKNTGDSTGYAQIRAAHDELAAENSDIRMGFVGAVNFAGRGLMIDAFHWSQDALNEVGTALADRAAAAL